MAINSFFGGAFLGGEFFNTPSVTVESGPTPAGRSSRGKRRVIVGDKHYEVDSLKDVEFLLKRIVREEAAPVARAAKARVRVVDRATAKLDQSAPVALPLLSVDVDWSSLWAQLAVQDRAYADALMRVLDRMEEDDIETLLLLH